MGAVTVSPFYEEASRQVSRAILGVTDQVGDSLNELQKVIAEMKQARQEIRQATDEGEENPGGEQPTD